MPGKKTIVSVLGLLILVGGLGAGVVLTQEQQLLNQKAAELTTSYATPPPFNACQACEKTNSPSECTSVCGTAPTQPPTPAPTPTTIALNACQTCEQNNSPSECASVCGTVPTPAPTPAPTPVPTPTTIVLNVCQSCERTNSPSECASVCGTVPTTCTGTKPCSNATCVHDSNIGNYYWSCPTNTPSQTTSTVIGYVPPGAQCGGLLVSGTNSCSYCQYGNNGDPLQTICNPAPGATAASSGCAYGETSKATSNSGGTTYYTTVCNTHPATVWNQTLDTLATGGQNSTIQAALSLPALAAGIPSGINSLSYLNTAGTAVLADLNNPLADLSTEINLAPGFNGGTSLGSALSSVIPASEIPQGATLLNGSLLIDTKNDQYLAQTVKDITLQVSAQNPSNIAETIDATQQAVSGMTSYDPETRALISQTAKDLGGTVPLGTYLENGGTVCRENAALCAVALNEQGIYAEVRAMPGVNGPGHAVVYVSQPLADGTYLKAIVDPTMGLTSIIEGANNSNYISNNLAVNKFYADQGLIPEFVKSYSMPNAALLIGK